MNILRALLLATLLGILATACGGDASHTPLLSPDSYLALVPRVLRAGETEPISVSLLAGQREASADVTASLQQDGKKIAEAKSHVDGKGTVALQVPTGTKGQYDIVVRGPGFDDKAMVQVQSGTLLFLETDKPIYKPGQTVMLRAVTLNSELKPLPGEVLIEISDAKGIKVFKQTVTTDEYGMASLQMPLSTEPNLGVWKVSGHAGETSTETDVRVEEYVLPKYEVKVELAKKWFLASEAIRGHVSATYSFGKPVNGDLKITASRYLGTWQEFGTVNATVVNGAADFEVPAAGYVAGVPEAGGQGNVSLNVSVVEKNTGYEEKDTELVTVAATPLNIKLIPEAPVFKPSLPFGVLVTTQTPDGQPVESHVQLNVQYVDENFQNVGHEALSVDTQRGSGLVSLTAPGGAVQASLSATSGNAGAQRTIAAAYSPSANFIRVSQAGVTVLKSGGTAHFHVDSTSEARNFYYEVVSRDRVVFTGASDSSDISFEVTPAMAGSSKLLAYQVLPTSEVAADFVPFDVQEAYPQQVSAKFSAGESKPGGQLEVDVQTEGKAKVGLVAIDRSVSILAENRLNLQQVFDEIERLYQQPRAELHEGGFMAPPPQVVPGAKDTFQDAGLTVLSNKKVPEGKKLPGPWLFDRAMKADAELTPGVPAPAAGQSAPGNPTDSAAGGTQALAEVQRVRQFFPETWLWQETLTGADGKAKLPVTAPDSITTWDLRAVALSRDKGLGVAQAQLRVFQPFFLQADLTYSATRGEEFPLKVSLYNYLDKPQDFQVEIEGQPWFNMLDQASKTVTVAPNDTGGVEFKIQPTRLGTQTVKVTARSAQAGDAVVKSIIVEPEGVQREQVKNGVLQAGSSRQVQLPLPDGIVEGSARTYVAVTGSLLGQTIQGLDRLLQMPFGCGEQNMILFAPDAFILKYLKGTNQLKPEIRAKAETFLITGYQRELTYRHGDGSFSAFGEQDKEGSLFLTAFVLKTFAQAKALTYIDDGVLSGSATWIAKHQASDGSFDAVGFVAHQDLMGGVQGKDALTSYVAIALLEAGQTQPAAKAVSYLEGRLDTVQEPYALALVTYALELGKSGRAQQAHDRLMAAARDDENGLHWSGSGPRPMPLGRGGPGFGQPAESSDVEATGYGTLALIAAGDQVNAGRAAKWLVSQRNSLGGFGSTQDTVVALQALTQFASSAGADSDLKVTVKAGEAQKELRITPDNFDVMQTVDVPAGMGVTVSAQGKGQALYQVVSRYNLPKPEEEHPAFDIKVDYETAKVAVNDTLRLNVRVKFNPPEAIGPEGRPLRAGMVVVDIAVPTGFSPVRESLDALATQQAEIKRYEVAARKVILYIDDMAPGQELQFAFDAKALYPVKGKGTASDAYSYYEPQLRGETISEPVAAQ